MAKPTIRVDKPEDGDPIGEERSVSVKPDKPSMMYSLLAQKI